MTIQNIGNMAGAEVVYISDVNTSEPQPVKELKQLKKITLSPNENHKITVDIAGKDLSFSAQKQNKQIDEGVEFEVLTGSSFCDI